MKRGAALTAFGLVVVFAIAGCSSSGSASSGSLSTGVPASAAVPTSAATGPTSSTSTTSTTSTTVPVSAAPVNEVVTDALRTQLLDAGAALNSLPPSDYTGLRPGQTYYAYDPATSTYWAGAGLVASSSSMQAQVSVQDDGSYLVFEEPAGGSWTASDAGFVGPDSTCAVTPPAAVLALWGWLPGTCHPVAG